MTVSAKPVSWNGKNVLPGKRMMSQEFGLNVYPTLRPFPLAALLKLSCFLRYSDMPFLIRLLRSLHLLRPACCLSRSLRRCEAGGGFSIELLLQHSNNNFVPVSEPWISIYARRSLALALCTGAGQHFISMDFEPGEPQCVNACGFLFPETQLV
jgi:hypothetical protein